MPKFVVILKDHSDVDRFKIIMGMRASHIEGTRAFECVVDNRDMVLIKNLEMVRDIEEVDERIKTKLGPMGMPESELRVSPDIRVKELGRYAVMRLSYSADIFPLDSEDVSALFADQLANITGLPGGENVDVVIVDGRLDPDHPEMKDSSGQTRVKSENWMGWAGEPDEPPVTFNQNSENDNHGQHVAGTACGLIQGWAKKSDIYNVYAYDGGYKNRIVGMKNWHSAKTNGRPTVTNHSYGRFWDEGTDVRYVLSADYMGATLFAPPMSGVTRATCVASLGINGIISSLNVASGGNGYTNAPDVSFSGGGRETAAAVMANGSVYRIDVTNPGSGYSKNSPPSVTFGPSPGGSGATGTCEVDDNGMISRVVMTNRGSGYVSAPAMTFGPPSSGGVQASGSVTIASNFISEISLMNGGDGHTDRNFFPAIVISGGGCQVDATWGVDVSVAISSESAGTLQNGLYKILEKVELTGSGFSQTPLGGLYSFAPKISFMYRPGHGPRAVAKVAGGMVTGLRMIENGPGFMSAPEIVLTNGCGFTPEQLENFGIGMIIQMEVGPGGSPIALDPGEGRCYIVKTPVRDSMVDSLMEDLISVGIAVVGAAGNTNSRIMNPGQTGYDDEFSYLGETNPKDAPSVFEEDSEFAPVAFSLKYARGSSPSAASGVLCVGSMSHTCCPEVKSPFSSSGPRINLYAPGEWIVSSVHRQATPHPTDASYGIQKYVGTSMSSPQVAGLVACRAQGESSFSQSDAAAFLQAQAKVALNDGQFPYQLRSGTDKVVNFPNLTVDLG